jgi:hypothetical protein
MLLSQDDVLTPPGAKDEPFYIYVWVRRDIPLVQQIIQVGHACYDAGYSKGWDNYADVMNGAMLGYRSPHMCLLQVPDQEALITVSNHLKFIGITYDMFCESDNNMGFSAICTEPIKGEVRNAFRLYELWQEDSVNLP